jgi:hypothetical protein
MAVLGAVAGLRLSSVINASGAPAFVDGEPTHISETGTWAFATAIQYLALATAGILLVVFLYRTSKALAARGPDAMTWGKGWTIGGWFIPLANLLIPRLVIAELERIAQVPFGGVPIGASWKQAQRSVVTDVWWLMWVGGIVVSWLGTVGGTAATDDNGRFTAFLTVSALSSLLIAGSGVALIVTLRSMARHASQ